MKVIVKSIVFLLSFTAYLLHSQAVPFNAKQALPHDTTVKIGKLENGLTYYIKSNKKPEKRAIFYLSVNAGSILETDDQVGLAHFTEHMGFNGTKQYPNNTLVSELEKKGIVFGREINAYTSFNETVYYVTLPTDDSTMFNMGLKILDGWAFGMLMAEEEIDKERGVIIEEWRTRGGAGERMRQITLPVELKNSKYINRLPIGTLENLQNFKYASIRNFYKTWYRPDNMAIIIVGDFNANDMEQMVIDFFLMNPIPSTPLKRPNYTIPNNKKPLIAIATDPEATNTQFVINYKHPKKTIKTYEDLKLNICRSLLTSILNARIAEIGNKTQAPFIHGVSYYGNYWSRTNESFSNRYVCKENRGLETFELALSELQRLIQYGILDSELERAKIELLSNYEKQAKEEDKKESRTFANQYNAHFLHHTPIISSKEHYLLAQEIMNQINNEDIHAIIKQLITDKNITITYTQPKKTDLATPNENDFLQILKKVKTIKTIPYVDEANQLPFLTKEPTAGKIIERKDNTEFNYTEIVLSNGAKVILKATDFTNDQILFYAFSKGGTSLYPNNKLVNAKYSTTIIHNSGIGNYNNNDLKKFMYGKNFHINPWIFSLNEGIDGSTSIKDMETFLQYIFMIFESPRKEQEELDKQIDAWRTSIAMYQNSPTHQFQYLVNKLKYPEDTISIIRLEEKHLEEMNLEEMYSIFRERFNNAKDFTFYFVGNLDFETVLPLIEKYIGGIPSKQEKENWIDKSSPFAKGITNETLYAGIGEKTQFVISTCQDFDWNTRNLLLINLLNNIVKIKMTEEIREKLGGTYGVNFSISTSKLPKEQLFMNIGLGCEPTRVEELTTSIWKVIDQIIENGVEELYLDKAKIQLIKAKEIAVKNNNTWLHNLHQLYEYDYPLLSVEEYKEIINNITTEEIKTIVKYMKHDEYVRVILMPASMKKE